GAGGDGAGEVVLGVADFVVLAVLQAGGGEVEGDGGLVVPVVDGDVGSSGFVAVGADDGLHAGGVLSAVVAAVGIESGGGLPCGVVEPVVGVGPFDAVVAEGPAVSGWGGALGGVGVV